MEFRNVAILGMPRKGMEFKATIRDLCAFLKKLDIGVSADERIAKRCSLENVETFTDGSVSRHADLAIVVGGDGSMIGAARDLAKLDIPVIGVNRGHLGFLADINPEGFEELLEPVLMGQYSTEQRTLLEVSVMDEDVIIETHAALNEAVIHPKAIAHMIDFEIFIDSDFMSSQRADGLIVCTPTGSTAYALSAGGPIMTPDINAYCLIPMFPHTLSNRPIVISDERTVSVDFLGSEAHVVTLDGQKNVIMTPHQNIIIKKSQTPLKLVHPKNYSYYHTLREKLGWGKKLF